LCAQEGNIETAQLLLAHKANFELAEHKLWRPLHIAASNGHANICELLLNAGAQVDSIEHLKWTPLMLAAQDGRTSTVELLLKRGADLNIREKDSRTALMIAALGDHTETAKLLIAGGADLNAGTAGRNATALYYAARRGRLGLLKLLLEHGANPNMPVANSTTLCDTIGQGHVEAARILMEHGATLGNALAYIPDVETLLGLVLAIPIQDFVIPTNNRVAEMSVSPNLLASMIAKAPHLRQFDIARLFQLEDGDATRLRIVLQNNFDIQLFNIGTMIAFLLLLLF